MDIIDKIKEWRHQWFLKTNGLTQKQYDRLYDKDVYFPATTVNNFYFGYPNIVAFDRNAPTELELHDMQDWCERTLTNKWREDIHRVYKQTGLGIDNKEYVTWFYDEMGGWDIQFFAFKDEKEYIAFLLRWC